LILDYKIRNSFSRTYIGRTELIHHQVRQQFLQNNKLVRVAFRQPYTLNQPPRNQRSKQQHGSRTRDNSNL